MIFIRCLQCARYALCSHEEDGHGPCCPGAFINDTTSGKKIYAIKDIKHRAVMEHGLNGVFLQVRREMWHSPRTVGCSPYALVGLGQTILALPSTHDYNSSATSLQVRKLRFREFTWSWNEATKKGRTGTHSLLPHIWMTPYRERLSVFKKKATWISPWP